MVEQKAAGFESSWHLRAAVSRYIARDPRTGLPLSRSKAGGGRNLGPLTPELGKWAVLPLEMIIPLATSEIKAAEIPLGEGGGFATKQDAIVALHRVREEELDLAHDAISEAIDEDDPRLRISAILGLPRMMLRRSENLMYQLVVRLDDPDPTVSDLAWETLERIAPIFPSSSELDMEALLRKTSKKQRDRAFKVLKAISKEWVEAGCQQIESLLKDEDVDLRRRSAKLLKVITERGGAVGWDLIAWALEDRDAAVRSSGADCLPKLASTEPRIAAILVEASLGERDTTVRMKILKAIKSLDMQNPRVARLIIDGASDNDVRLRRACISQLSAVLTGASLREAAGELARTETDPDLKRQLMALAFDPEMEGTEEEKNRFLAELDPVEDENEQPQLKISGNPPQREGHKQEQGRQVDEELQ